MLQSEAGASAPFAWSAAFMTAYVLGGNFFRSFHIGTADGLFRLVISFTASKPPSSEMTSSMVESCLVMTHSIITSRDNVKRHEKELEQVPFVLQNDAMGEGPEKPYFEQGRRLRWLRQAERIRTATEFAAKYGWPQSGMSQFETGARQIPASKALELQKTIPGFNVLYIWTGEKKDLSFDLRQRIDAEEAKEMSSQSAGAAER